MNLHLWFLSGKTVFPVLNIKMNFRFIMIPFYPADIEPLKMKMWNVSRDLKPISLLSLK